MSQSPIANLGQLKVQFAQADWTKLTELFNRMRRDFPKAAARAVNRTLITARKTASEEVREELEVKAASVKRRINITRKASAGSPSGVVTVSRDSTPSLISFGKPRDTRSAPFDPDGQGVTVKVRRGKPAERHPHAFIAKGKGGVEQIFERRSRAGFNRAAKSRIVLRALRGPSVLGVFQHHPGIKERVTRETAEALRKNAISQINFEIFKLGGPPAEPSDSDT